MNCNVVIHDLEHLNDVRSFAESVNAYDQFSKVWSKLIFLAANYASNPRYEKVTLSIGKDWAEHSFSWAILATGVDFGEKTGRLLNGGLIYHGTAQTKDNLSIRLMGDGEKHEWCLHT